LEAALDGWALDGGNGGRTRRADKRGAALLAAIGGVFKIVRCSTVSEPGGLAGCKHHLVTALGAGEHEARQAGLWNVRAVHGTLSAPATLAVW
jgi:hypothetical protein